MIKFWALIYTAIFLIAYIFGGLFAVALGVLYIALGSLVAIIVLIGDQLWGKYDKRN